MTRRTVTIQFDEAQTFAFFKEAMRRRDILRKTIHTHVEAIVTSVNTLGYLRTNDDLGTDNDLGFQIACLVEDFVDTPLDYGAALDTLFREHLKWFESNGIHFQRFPLDQPRERQVTLTAWSDTDVSYTFRRVKDAVLFKLFFG